MFIARLLAVLAAFACCWSPALAQQAYPARAVRILIPFTPGGASDIQARIIAQKLTERWGQTVIAENRPGGTTVLATDLAAKAPPDGYTVLFVTTAFAINPSLRSVPYDIINDFAPVIWLSSSPGMLVAHPTVPANNIRELIALARAPPGELNYASAGAGTAAHVSIELFQTMAKVKLTHIPYKGINQAFFDLMSGQVSLLITSPVAALPYVKQGKVKALAVTSLKRSAAAPNVPTIGESGVPLYESSSFQGMVAPGRTPRDIVTRLYNDINTVSQLPDVRERLSADGSEYVGGSPETFAAHIKAQHAKWAKVVKESGAKVD